MKWDLLELRTFMYVFIPILGDCNSDRECQCLEKELEGNHLKCVSDAVCKMYCHFDKKAATGKCQGQHGSDCVCYEDPEENQVISDDE